MKFSYKFSNLLGSVYRKGNLLFTPDGNSVISPVGNKITIFDLKNNKAETLPIESRFNLDRLSISPDGCIMIAVNEEGEALLISLVSRTVLHDYRFNKKINDIKFSPDKRYFAVTKDSSVFLYKAPGYHKEFNPFVLEKVFKGAFDETVCIDWSSDSKVLAVGSKDMSTRIYAVDRFSNLSIYSLGGHSDSIVGCFFEENSLNIYTVSRNGQLCVWLSTASLDELIPITKPTVSSKKKEEGEDDDIGDGMAQVETIDIPSTENVNAMSKIQFHKGGKHYYNNIACVNGPASLTAATFHRQTHILVTGFSNGAFFLHEMPEFNLINSLSMEEQFISTLTFNRTGDWIAIGCQNLGQLIVWEWQSESYIMKQQGHFHSMNCLAYSPDSSLIATGGDDSKVKIWNVSSGFCVVTFVEHQGIISGIAFSRSGKFIVSSSLDGTVRAFDLQRYRNFRTFTSPRPCQFSCVALDSSGEIVCAGAQDVFEIFVWSVQNGRLLEVLAGHEGPVSSVSFSSQQSLLASASWDKTVRLWDIFDSKGYREIINTTSDALVVLFRPDGKEIAVATLDSTITFFSIPNVVQTGTIEGRNDLGSGRRDTDLIKPKNVLKGKCFTTLCYSADGQCILAAGQSKHVCIYSVKEQILLKKFEITRNRSLDGIDDMINLRKMTEFGNLALIEEREEGETPVAISLPGVKKGDMASRVFKPEVRVSFIMFAPTGRSWAATTTEGLLMYSLDAGYIFDPMQLELDVTPLNIRKTLSNKDYSSAIMQSFKLNEKLIIMEIIESIPVNCIDAISRGLPPKYVALLLEFLAAHLENTRHVEFYLLWIQALLMSHGEHLKLPSMGTKALLQHLQKNLNQKYKDLRSVCEFNKYGLAYIISLAEQKKRKNLDELFEEDMS